ncbi:MAG: hypothetical protein AB7K09_18625 [Planctomycetota bacterium]
MTNDDTSTTNPAPLAAADDPVHRPDVAPAPPAPDLNVAGGDIQSAVLIRFFMPLIIGILLVMLFAFFTLMMNAN